MGKLIDSQEKFDTYIDEVIPCAFFHVEPKDIDEKTGAKLEDIILLNVLSEHPELLKFKSLDWFVKYFITGHNWDTIKQK